LFKRHEAVIQVVPKYKELSVQKVWTYVAQNDELIEYFPDLADGQFPERDYLFAIVSTLYPKSLRKLIEEARIHRAKAGDEDDEELIWILPEIKKSIMDIISQKGKFKVFDKSSHKRQSLESTKRQG
jgi:hypothetical protein